MDIGEPTITVGNSTSIGPIRVEIGQMLSPPTLLPTPLSYDADLLTEAKITNQLLLAIYQHLTRPPWWRRLLERIKQCFTLSAK